MVGDHKCLKSCFGLYADVSFEQCKRHKVEDAEVLELIEEEYNMYKTKYVENLFFDQDSSDYSK